MASKPTEEDENENVVPMKGLKGLAGVRVLYDFAQRMGWGRTLTGTMGKRDYNTVFGWDNILSNQAMRLMYNRGGIAKRVIDAYPDAIWSRAPTLYAAQDPAWTTAFAEFAKAQSLWSVLNRADKLAGLGEYAIILLGASGKLDPPLSSANKINYMQPYGQDNARVVQWNTDSNSPDFGAPLVYQVYPDGAGITQRGGTSTSTTGPVRASFLVHASRVLHIAQGNLEDKIFGQPRMAAIWDYLTDLRKVVGSSSESYWIMANRGLQADVDKEMTLSAEDAANLSDEIDEYFDGFRRFIRTKGVKMNTLQGDVADPSGPFDVLVTLIAGTTKIPKRILTGSEAGQLASSEDKGNWAESIEQERANQSEPNVLVPLINKLISLGTLKAPIGGVDVLWQDAYRMSPLERGQTAAQTARSLANVVKGMQPIEIVPAIPPTPGTPDQTDAEGNVTVKGTPASEGAPAVTAPALITREEARAIIGLSTDNRVLADTPDV